MEDTEGPSITLVQLIRQLRKHEGRRIDSAQGLAMALVHGAYRDARAEAEGGALLAAALKEDDGERE